MRKCDKIVFDQVSGKEARHAVYRSLLEEEIKLKRKSVKRD